MNRIGGKLMEFTALGEQLYQEALDIWMVHGGIEDEFDQAVADQLYAGDLIKAKELKAGITALHEASEKLDWRSMRRVANIVQARMG